GQAVEDDPDAHGDPHPYPDRQPRRMHVHHLVEGFDVERGDIRVHVALGIGDGDVPQATMHQFRTGKELAELLLTDVAATSEHQSRLYVLTQQAFALDAIGFRKESGSQIGGAYRISIIADKRLAGVVALGDDRKTE